MTGQPINGSRKRCFCDKRLILPDMNIQAIILRSQPLGESFQPTVGIEFL